MAEVVLKITGDNTSAENALNETANTLSGVSTVAKKTSTDIKKGLDDIAASAKKANDEMSNPKPTENQKKVLNATQQLKKEIKEFEAAAIKAGEGTDEFARNIAEAGKKKAELKDLKEAIAALDPDAVAKTFLGLASSVAGGFTVAQSAIALTGVKSEELERTLLKVQAAQGVLAGLQQLANTKDELGKAKIIILNKLNTLEIKKNIVAVEGATIAQRIWNLAMASNPIGLLVAALTVLGTIVAAYISETEASKKAEIERSKAIDGTIIKSKELRDAYNESLVALREVENAYKVLNGQITELEANLDNIEQKSKISIQNIKNDTNAQLAEASASWKEYLAIIGSSTGLFTRAEVDNARTLEIRKTGAEKLKAEELKLEAERAKAVLEADKKSAAEKARNLKEANDKLFQAEKDFQDALKSLRDKARSAEIQSLTGSERIEAERKLNQEAVDELEKSLIQKGKLTDANFKLALEQQQQLAIIRNQIDKEANDKTLALRRDFYEKAKQETEQSEQEANRIASEEVDKNQKSLEEANKAKILLAKEGSKERLDAEINALETERDFILQNTTLTNDQRIILEQETLQKITDLQKDFATKNPSSLAKLLGVTDEELDKIKSALGRLTDQFKTFFSNQISEQQKMLYAQIKANEDTVNSRENTIKDLQSQLEKELQLQKDGLANNVDAIRQQIADEQAAKQSALENEKKIKEEKKKLAIEQLAIDSATQLSDLITASAETFKAFSAIPFVGIPLAVAAIGLMFGSFAAAKVRAVQSINQGFKEGVIDLQGPGTETSDSIPANLSRGESVMTAKTTKKHKALLEALHKDDYSHLTIKDLSPLLAGTGVVFNNEALNEINIDQAKYNKRKSEEPARLIAAMEATNKNITKFFQHYKNQPKPPIEEPDGSMVYKIGNTTRRVRKT